MRQSLFVEEAAKEIGGLDRVAGRIAGVDAREGLQEFELTALLGLQPVQQFFARVHALPKVGTGASCTTTPFLTTPRHDAPPIA